MIYSYAGRKAPVPEPQCRHGNPRKGCWECAQKNDKQWWTATLWPTIVARLFRAAGRAKLWEEPWADSIAKARWKSRGRADARAVTIRAVRYLADRPDEAIAFDSVYRLQGAAVASRWIVDILDPPPPPMAAADALALAHAAKARKAADREAHARKMLIRWQGAQRRAEAAVARWSRQVAYYDKRHAKAADET